MESRKTGTNLRLAIFMAGSLSLGAITAIADENSQAPSVAELSAEWWQWQETYFGDLNVEGLVNCDDGQLGNVWFLAGSAGGAVERECIDAIPPGKRLFFPLINLVAFDEESPRELLDDILSDVGGGLFSAEACKLYATVDGKPVIFSGTAIQRVQSPPFEYASDPEAVSDGFWVLLPQLSGGDHTIEFGGAFCEFETGNALFGVDAKYHLTVLGRRGK